MKKKIRFSLCVGLCLSIVLLYGQSDKLFLSLLDGDANAYAEVVETPYAPGELIVKFTPEVAAIVYDALEGGSFGAILSQAASLDQLNVHFSLVDARRVFQSLEMRDAKGAYSGFKTAEQYVAAIKEQYPERGDRGKRNVVVPDLENIFLLTIDAESDIPFAAQAYADDANVVYAHPNHTASLAGVEPNQDMLPESAQSYFMPYDPYYYVTGSPGAPGSWGQPFDDMWSLQADILNMGTAWNAGGNINLGEGIVVAVVDTGIDYTHPEIANAMWVNPGEDLNQNGTAEGERFNDTGIDGLFNREESGYSSSNPDPNGDDYDSETNPTGTEGNGGYDMGEPFEDCGLDTVCPDHPFYLTHYGIDTGEGNSVYDSGEKDGIDNDGNGYVDDLYGYDMINVDADPYDTKGHGTHVAGTIAAESNFEGIVGIVPAAKIMALKIFGSRISNFAVPTSDMSADALYYAANHGALVINNSWIQQNKYSDPTVEAAIEYAHDVWGCVVVFAAGNKNKNVMTTPFQRHPKTIAVAATDYNDDKMFLEDEYMTPGSNHGELVDVAAPGEEILSLKARVYGGESPLGPGIQYMPLSGTSMAAPHVSGLAALLFSVLPSNTDPELVRTIITACVDPLGSVQWMPYSDREVYLGTGRIDAGLALEVATMFPPEALSELSVEYMQSLGEGPVSIEGTSSGVSYQVSYADASSGPYPEAVDWTLLAEGVSGVGELAELDTSALTMGQYYIKLSTEDSSGLLLADRVKVVVDNELEAGWPQRVSERIVSSPVVADFDADGDKEIFVVAYDGKTYLFNHDGSRHSSSWPFEPFLDVAEVFATPAVSDLDGNGDLEIVMNHGDDVVAFHHDASLLWQRSFDQEYSAGSLSIGDINGDGSPEVVYPSFSLDETQITIRVLDALGNDVAPWPFIFSGDEVDHLDSTATLADIDQDGDDDIVVSFTRKTTTYLREYVVTVLDDNAQPLALPGSQWPRSYEMVSSSNYTNGSPSVGDVDRDGDLEIFVVLRDRIFGFDHLGQELAGWPKIFSGLASELTLADIDGNRDLEIALQKKTTPYRVRAYDHNGSVNQEWPLSTIGLYRGSPDLAITHSSVTVGDVSGDAIADVLFGFSEEEFMYAFKHNGSLVPEFPKELGDSFNNYLAATNTIADLDGDGDAEIIAGGLDKRVYVWDLQQPLYPSTFEWPMYRHDLQNSGNYNQNVLFVPSATYPTIGAAINAVRAGHVITVMPGTYNENIVLPDKQITIKSLDGPDETIIHGVGNGPAVRFLPTTGPAATIDGFTITGGNHVSNGGGIYAEAAISPIIKNCKIINNTSAVRGGGVHFYSTMNPKIINCLIADNTALYGGGVNIEGTGLTLLNSTIADNSATWAGAIHGELASVEVTNSIIRTDGVPGSAIEIISPPPGDPIIVPPVSYTNIEGGWSGPGEGNIDANPLFIDPTSGDFHLAPHSPCIDSADGDAAPLTDLDGNPRFNDWITDDTGIGNTTYADMGALERQEHSEPIITPKFDRMIAF
ncbi:S8 family serine peptidase [Candidatus Omnitrophota bacterium]